MRLQIFRGWAQSKVDSPDPSASAILAGVMTVILAFWPLVWVVWAFLLRGGLSFRLLGLALVRRLVELHGGTVAATSDGYALRFSLEPLVEPSTRAGRRFARPSAEAEILGVARITGDEVLIAATAEESILPDRNAPSGTSDTRRRFTASPSIASSAFAASSSLTSRGVFFPRRATSSRLQ